MAMQVGQINTSELFNKIVPYKQDKSKKILLSCDLNEFWPTKRNLIHELICQFPSLYFQTAYTSDEQKFHILDSDATFGIPSANIFELNRKLTWVHHPVSGFELQPNHPIIDSDVILTNAPNAHVISMAEYVFATMLSLTHKIPEHIKDQQNRIWDSSKYLSTIQELTGQTLGIVGYGEVGKAIAVRAFGFGMNVYGISRTPKTTGTNFAIVWTPGKIEELLKISDWLVIAAPLTKETRNLINEARIQLIKPNAYVIILSRAHILDEKALVTRLINGNLAGAVFDNFETGTIEESSPLWDMDNVIITPHTSSMSINLERDRFNIFRENLDRYINGKPFIRVADKTGGY